MQPQRPPNRLRRRDKKGGSRRMRRYTQKPGDQRRSETPAVSRRVMLIASGGLMLGVAGAVGCANQNLAAATLDQTPAPSGRTSPRRSPQPGQTSADRKSAPSPPDRASPPSSHPDRDRRPRPGQAGLLRGRRADDDRADHRRRAEPDLHPADPPDPGEVPRHGVLLDGRGERDLLPRRGQGRRRRRSRDRQPHLGPRQPGDAHGIPDPGRDRQRHRRHPHCGRPDPDHLPRALRRLVARRRSSTARART